MELKNDYIEIRFIDRLLCYATDSTHKSDFLAHQYDLVEKFVDSSDLCQQILYGIIFETEINDNIVCLLKLGTTTVGGFDKRLKSHKKTYGKTEYLS